jgi:hypothetical protein
MSVMLIEALGKSAINERERERKINPSNINYELSHL